jgi:hypothetical protein
LFSITSLFNSCHQLELQLQSTHNDISSNDVEIQCSVDKQDQFIQTIDNEKISKDENSKLKSQIDVSQDEIRNLNFQLSSFIIQRTTAENVRIKFSINQKKMFINNLKIDH